MRVGDVVCPVRWQGEQPSGSGSHVHERVFQVEATTLYQLRVSAHTHTPSRASHRWQWAAAALPVSMHDAGGNVIVWRHTYAYYVVRHTHSNRTSGTHHRDAVLHGDACATVTTHRNVTGAAL